MRYKVSNIIKDDIGERKLVSVFDSFESVIDKTIKDLQSAWKGVVPLPLNITIESVSDDEQLGMKLVDEEGKVLAKNEFEVEGALEVLTSISKGDDTYSDADKIAMNMLDKELNKGKKK